MSAELYQTLKETATNHIRAFESPDPFDPEQIYAYRDPKCIMRFHASNSMPEPFGNDLHISRKEHEPALRMLGELMSRMKADIKLIVVDTEQRVVSTWLQMVFDFKATAGQPEEKDYMIEYVSCYYLKIEMRKKILLFSINSMLASRSLPAWTLLPDHLE